MGKNGPEFGPKTAFRDAAARVLIERLDAVMAREAGTRAGTDTEELHDMRVASRRLRAAVEAFGVCYRGKEFARAAKQTKQLTDALGGVRDSDVLLARMEAYFGIVPPDEQPAIAGFLTQIRAERETRRAAMMRALDALAATHYEKRFRALAARPRA